MTELTAADVDRSVGWYRDVLGLTVERLDAPNRFALLSAAGGGRLALKAGPPAAGGVRLHFEVADLAAAVARLTAAGCPPDGDPKDSPEGYRRAVFRDPDGHPVTLFAWVSPAAARR